MSFYDLTKDNVLSANELFKYRIKRDATLPSKGGQKIFEPDDSWIQAKALESFMQERTKLLGEQRVEKLKSLVQGVWEEQRRLISVSKTGKFWSHMGFTDKRRNWLYPEEALYLMETNTLEVYYNGLPLSIQEAYTKFMGPDLSLEEYQVFAHLRRLGYVVLRQETELEITPYEKQINLDKYITKQNRKERKEKLLMKKKNADNDESLVVSDERKESHCKNDQFSLSDGKGEAHNNKSQDNCGNVYDLSTSSNDHNKNQDVQSNENQATFDPSFLAKRSSQEAGHLSESSPHKRFKTDSTSKEKTESLNSSLELQSPSSNDQPGGRWYWDAAWAQCFKKSLTLPQSLEASTEFDYEAKSSVKDLLKPGPAQSFPFPTIVDRSVISLPQPGTKLLPSNVVVNEDYKDVLVFNVEKYRSQHPPREETKSSQREDEREARVRNLSFSFAEWMKKTPIKAKNWGEYKQKSKKALVARTAQTPVDHLWKGDITPLVKPDDAWSKQTILDRLDIIQIADNDSLIPNEDCMVDLKVSFCVHLPDSRFRKSMPGTPDHRVCVIKCSAEPPNLAEVQEVWSRFKDGVPLHCAVVDSGEIAFYQFDNTFKLELLPY